MRERPRGVRRRGTGGTAEDPSRRRHVPVPAARRRGPVAAGGTGEPDPVAGNRGTGVTPGDDARDLVPASMPSPRTVGRDGAAAGDPWPVNGNGRHGTATPGRSVATGGLALAGGLRTPLATTDVPPPGRTDSFAAVALGGPSPLGEQRTHRAGARNERRVVVPQRAGAVLLAVALVGGAAWYVPHVAAADAGTVAGTVTNGNVVDLNFGGTGQLSTIKVHVGQPVRRGQVLATEHAPLADATVTADRQAIAADHSRLAVLEPHASANPVAVADAYAQLAKDEDSLAVDRAKLAQTEIVAPAAGTVAAVNGQAGETAGPQGLRNYPSQSRGSATREQPLFSLLPEGPQASLRHPQSSSALPVIALRTAGTWSVTVLVPESSVTRVRAGQPVTISVPADHISGLAGRIGAAPPAPVNTPDGLTYQVVVAVVGRADRTPLNGMAADVTLRR